jgi:hypothetical protein
LFNSPKRVNFVFFKKLLFFKIHSRSPRRQEIYLQNSNSPSTSDFFSSEAPTKGALVGVKVITSVKHYAKEINAETVTHTEYIQS